MLGFLGLCIWFVVAVLLPGWLNPSNRTFDSGIGYAKVVRSTGGAFELTSATAQQRTFSTRYLGEGRLQSDNILIPVIPMGLVTEVLVEPGQFVEKGELLLRLDDKRPRLRLAAAQAAVQKAEADLKRRQIGSHQTQALEQAAVEQRNLQYRRQEKKLTEELVKRYQPLLEKGTISRLDFVNILRESTQAAREAGIAEERVQQSIEGQKHAQTVAEMHLQETRIILDEREIELAEYEVRAPAAGMVREVLVRPSEFNRNPGKPGLILSTGLWFEGRLGQSALVNIAPGMACEVALEAYPGQTFPGKLTRIVPFVDHDLGGPETTRPIRPRGTSAPQWPSTFKILVTLVETPVELAPGMTGHVMVLLKREGLGVPDAGLDSFSSAQGLVFKVEGVQEPPEPQSETDARWVNWSPQTVRTGLKSDGWTEVLEGLKEGDEILLGGQGMLNTSDRVKIVPASEKAQ